MKKVYQRIIDPGKGDCMQAAMASLFDDEYENVPSFIEYDNFYELWNQYLESKGYIGKGIFHNKNWNILLNPTYECWNEHRFYQKALINHANIEKVEGVNSLFYCTVLSPKYFKWDNISFQCHAVLCDKNFNIVHDPNKEYEGIKSYPLSSILDYSGIISIHNFVKIK